MDESKYELIRDASNELTKTAMEANRILMEVEKNLIKANPGVEVGVKFEDGSLWFGKLKGDWRLYITSKDPDRVASTSSATIDCWSREVRVRAARVAEELVEKIGTVLVARLNHLKDIERCP